ncbi:MAG: response regulator [Burkholderiaceae bacterium]|nr:response regulator [Burkholderiaceae bacterium]
MIDRYLEPGPTALERAAREIGLTLTPAHRQQVVHEQMRMVLLHTRVGTLAATVFAVLLAWHLQPLVPGLPVAGWLAVKLAVALARIALAQAYQRLGAGSPHWLRWQRAMLLLLAADGLVWGLAGWRLSGESLPVMALAVAALDGVSCIATFGLQVRLAATAAYVLPMLLLVALGLAMRADENALFAAAAQLILLVLLLLTARATSRQLVAGMLLRLQADRLVAEKDAALRLAQERSAERDRFLAKVSHELRTPLHGMLGLARLLHLESREPTLSHRLELIESSGTHLLGLINDLLEVSRIDAGHFTLREDVFDLAAQLQQIADLFTLRAADKGLGFTLRLELPRPCWVRGDAARLRQVLNNLLGNAIKFTRQGGILLEARPGAQPDRVRLAVHDTGVGISAAELARIFQPFHQAGTGSSGMHTTDGVGLGLTIAREIAIAMGSDIQVHSATGVGSSFSFEAALPRADPTVVPAGPAQGGPRLPRLVLVAEDDEVNALIVNAFLDNLGVRCERVADGKQAVSRALRETDRPELVLMDCRMPVMDGLAATAEIRRQEHTLGLRRLPIIALTATATEVDLQSCLAAGMDAVIAKPFTPVQLAQAMRDAAALPH